MPKNELDKLLKLDRVPPVVERDLQGYKGGATFGVENILPSNGGAPSSESDRSRWEKQLPLMMMFDNRQQRPKPGKHPPAMPHGT